MTDWTLLCLEISCSRWTRRVSPAGVVATCGGTPCASSLCASCGDGAVRGWPVTFTAISSGPLVPTPKPFGESVVGLAIGGVLRQLTEVLRAQAQIECGNRDQAQNDDPGDGSDQGVIADRAGPPEPAARVVRIALPLAQPERQLEDSPAEQAEDRGKERDRGEDRRGDHHRRRVAERADQGDAAEVEAEQGDDHGASGEDDGRARGADGAGDRFVGLHPLLQEAQVPADDEQGVVRPHREPEHDPQGRVRWTGRRSRVPPARRWPGRRPGRRSRWSPAAVRRRRCGRRTAG